MKYAAHDAWEWEWSVILQRRLIHLQNWGIWEKWDEIITDTNTLIKILIQEFNKEFIWLYHVSQLNECTLTLPLHVSGFWWWFWPDRERVWLSICNSVRLEMISRLVKWKKTLISLNLWEESEYTKVNMDGKRKTSKVRVVAASFARLCSQPGETLRCQLTCPALQQGCHSTWPAGWSAATLSWPAIFQHREPWSIPGVDPAPQGSRSSQLEPLQHLAQGSALRQAGLGHCTPLATAGLLSLRVFSSFP